MKKILFLLLFTFQLFPSQFVHLYFHQKNSDSDTRKKVAEVLAHTSARVIQLQLQNDDLKEMISNNKQFLERNYKKSTKFDKQDGFIIKSLTTGALGIAPVIFNKFSTLPYMTNTKKDYLTSLALDKLVLLSLQNLDVKKIKSVERQEIYRIRNQLVRVYSKNDKETINVMALPILGLLASGDIALLSFIKDLEIVL